MSASFASVRSTIYAAYHLIDCIRERIEYSNDPDAAAHTAALAGIKVVLDRAGDEIEEVEQKWLDHVQKAAAIKSSVDEDVVREQQGAIVIDLFEALKKSLALKAPAEEG